MAIEQPRSLSDLIERPGEHTITLMDKDRSIERMKQFKSLQEIDRAKVVLESKINKLISGDEKAFSSFEDLYEDEEKVPNIEIERN